MLRPHSSLFNVAGNDPAAAAGAGAGLSKPPAVANDPAAAPKVDPAVKELQQKWKGKDYAAIAAHHVELTQAGHSDEAAFFHKHVVMTYQAKH